jgi:hypothetical protein
MLSTTVALAVIALIAVGKTIKSRITNVPLQKGCGLRLVTTMTDPKRVTQSKAFVEQDLI